MNEHKKRYIECVCDGDGDFRFTKKKNQNVLTIIIDFEIKENKKCRFGNARYKRNPLKS